MQASPCRLAGIDSTRRSSLMNRSAWKRLWCKESSGGMHASRLCGHCPCFQRSLYQRRAASGALPHGFRSRRVHRWFRRTGSGWIRIRGRGPDGHQGLFRNAAGQRSRCIATTGHVTDSELLRKPDEPEGCSSEEDEERTPAERSRFAEKQKKIDPAAFEATSGSSGRSASTVASAVAITIVCGWVLPGLAVRDRRTTRACRRARSGRPVCSKPVAGRCCAARAAR